MDHRESRAGALLFAAQRQQSGAHAFEARAFAQLFVERGSASVDGRHEDRRPGGDESAGRGFVEQRGVGDDRRDRAGRGDAFEQFEKTGMQHRFAESGDADEKGMAHVVLDAVEQREVHVAGIDGRAGRVARAGGAAQIAAVGELDLQHQRPRAHHGAPQGQVPPAQNDIAKARQGNHRGLRQPEIERRRGRSPRRRPRKSWRDRRARTMQIARPPALIFWRTGGSAPARFRTGRRRCRRWRSRRSARRGPC
ncbi:MAG: hypothetical protein BWZ10_00496 [candidate division BRC1 bacterium ADurb.BinA364]|nr:MAG: hypothetical protein BWZ10_00496 [candidate division BRC1 bacterium ADurb.BinA364]